MCLPRSSRSPDQSKGISLVLADALEKRTDYQSTWKRQTLCSFSSVWLRHQHCTLKALLDSSTLTFALSTPLHESKWERRDEGHWSGSTTTSFTDGRPPPLLLFSAWSSFVMQCETKWFCLKSFNLIHRVCVCVRLWLFGFRFCPVRMCVCMCMCSFARCPFQKCVRMITVLPFFSKGLICVLYYWMFK